MTRRANGGIVGAMNRTPLAITAIALAAAAIAVPGSPAQSANTIDLTFPQSAPDAVTDGGKRGPSAGDRLAFNGRLTQGRTRAGTFLATADILNNKGTSALMVATLELPGRGAIAAQGRLNFNRSNQGTLAVTGGTGEFEGAGGAISVTADRNERITLKVELGS